ncbi:hypothetical protein Aros01_06660 [Streptosporangium roseum]|uniref:Uncharacterized protein n=1 Tax=Streptosporangium roseum (strain ATCC 12428 / DSM 43021 / JCM 3005 / KCTC 9067 / NCIMB 10171 / NRRL 2505 / NI 9100) TaxID=479432 RepID=D2B1W0_STRRD|nr:hypothetical protein Sros_6470 [Streptosporangium roseum DSM 43021]
MIIDTADRARYPPGGLVMIGWIRPGLRTTGPEVLRDSL